MSSGFVCFTCGEEWPEHPALKVACPRCKAKAGSPCVRPSEHGAFGGAVHNEREELAVSSGVLTMCPKGPTAMAKAKAAQEPTLFGVSE